MEDERVDQDDSVDSKSFVKSTFTILLLLALGGIFTFFYSEFKDYQAKEDSKSKAIISAVMNSEGTVPGTKVVDALSMALAASGKFVKVVGWECNKSLKEESYDVWLNLTVNDHAEKLHWVVDRDNNLLPANDLAQQFTLKQKLQL